MSEYQDLKDQISRAEQEIADVKNYLEKVERSRAERQPEKSPGDRLADVVWNELNAGMRTAQYKRLQAAYDTYHSTKNAHPTSDQLFGSPPDPVKVARLLLDSLTSGALSSLICAVRDMPDNEADPVYSRNLKEMIKHLGEKL